MRYLIISSLILLFLSCEYTTSGSNDLLDYSKPISLLNYNNFRLTSSWKVEGSSNSSSIIDKDNEVILFKNGTFNFIATGSTDTAFRFFNMTHLTYHLVISYKGFLEFQNIDSISSVLSIVTNNSNDFYNKAPNQTSYTYKNLYIRRDDENEFHLLYDPILFFNSISNTSHTYEIEWRIGLNSGINDRLSFSNEVNESNYTITIKLDSYLY